MKNFKIISKSILFIATYFSYSYAVVSTPTPATTNIVNQMSSSMSHSVVNSSNVINNSQNVTSNLINSTNLKQDIKENAEKLDLKVDEGALSALSNVSSDSKEIAKEMEKMKDNIEEKDHDYVMTLDQDVVVYDSGWFTLERVETGSNGLTYNKPSTSDVFADAVQEGTESQWPIHLKAILQLMLRPWRLVRSYKIWCENALCHVGNSPLKSAEYAHCWFRACASIQHVSV